MKTTRTLKRNRRIVLASIIAALFALITFAGFSLVNPLTAASADTTTYTYVALGDSITTGYGLSDPDTEGFAAQLATSTNTTVYNAGVDGQTSTELITSTLNSSAALAALQTAEIVTVTIGGNDLMEAFYSFIAEITGNNADDVKSALTDPSNNITTALIILSALNDTDWSSQLTSYSAFTDAVEAAVTNINALASAIKQYNSGAVILVANQYNPYQWLGSSYQNIINLFETGVTTYNSYLSSYANGAYNVVDVYSAFAASSATLTNVNIMSYDFDFHPNAAGHTAIATAMAKSYAAATASAIQLGADAITTGNTLYLGTYNRYNVPWIVLDDNGTLLSEYILNTYYFFYSTGFDSYYATYGETGITYANSDLNDEIDHLYHSMLTSLEQSQINETYYTDRFGNYSSYFYALSSDEASALSDDVRIAYYINNTSTAGAWWTRTIFGSGSSVDISLAYIISTDGNKYTPAMDGSYGVRPAASLNTANVLFTSAAADGKEASGMDGGLTAVETYSNGTDWKATIYDDSRAGFTASRTSKDGNVITIDYSGAATGTGEYISAIVVDSDGAVTQYGRLLQLDGTTNAASGTFTLDVSSLSSSDTLYIINEQYNGSYATDYSSALTAIDLSKTAAELSEELAQLEADLLANQQAIITSANSSLTASLLNFATIVNDSNSTTADIIDGVIALLTEYSSAYTSWEQITAQSPTDTTLLTSLATLEATLTTAESAITTAITTLQTNISAQISDLQTADADLLADLTALQTTVNNLNGTYATDSELAAAITALQTTLTTAQTAVIDEVNSDLETSINALSTLDSDSTLSEIITVLSDIQTAYATANTALIQVKADSPANATLLASIATLETTITSAESAMAQAIAAIQDNIDAQISALKTTDGNLADDIADLLSDLTTLQTTVGSLDGTYATDSELAAAVTTLNAAIADAQQAAIDAAQASLNAAVEELNKAISDGDKNLSDEIAAVDSAYKTADTIINGLITDLQTKDVEITASITTLESTMNTADAALQTAIDTVQTNLEKAVDDLNKAISDGDSDLADEIAALEAAMNTADDIINGDIAALQYTDRVHEINIASLNTRLLDAQETLQNAVDAVQQNLNDAVANLEAAIAAGDEDLSDEIEALNTAFTAAANLINTNITALQTADGELETSISALETAVNSADSVLQAAIDELQQQLNDLKAEHEAAITDAQNSADALQTVCIAMFTVTGILSIAGVSMSAALWIVTRKRR